MNIKSIARQSLIGAACIALSMQASAGSEQRNLCKSAVMTETREFMDIPMAAFSMNGHHHHNLFWTVHWDGQTANGSCKFHNGHFKGVEIQTHLKHSHHQKKSKHYQGQYGGFYYDHHVGKWRDPDGHACHTCTPENGFPDRGH
jgi:hypothetical protein